MYTWVSAADLLAMWQAKTRSILVSTYLIVYINVNNRGLS